MIKRKRVTELGKDVPAVYIESVEIGTSDVDPNRIVKVSALQKIFQEVASDHSKIMSIGFEDLAKQNLSWVVSRFNTEIIRRPKLYEKILVRTWPLQPGVVESEREFEVEDSDGNLIMRATSKWCIIDTKTRKPTRMSEFTFREPQYTSRRALEYKFPDYYGKDLSEEKHLTFERRVRLSDLDLNGHMNNTIYVDMIFDVLTDEEYNKNTFEGLYMKYKKEARLGDVIEIKKYYIGDLICVKGFVNSREIFESVIDILTEEERISKRMTGV